MSEIHPNRATGITAQAKNAMTSAIDRREDEQKFASPGTTISLKKKLQRSRNRLQASPKRPRHWAAPALYGGPQSSDPRAPVQLQVKP